MLKWKIRWISGSKSLLHSVGPEDSGRIELAPQRVVFRTVRKEALSFRGTRIDELSPWLTATVPQHQALHVAKHITNVAGVAWVHVVIDSALDTVFIRGAQ